jgi:hypothetical protein
MNSSSNKAFVKSFVGNVSAIVHQKAVRAVSKAFLTAQYHNPVWSGQMVASWNISMNQPNYKVVYHPATENGTVRIDKPANPLEAKSLEQALSESNVYGFKMGEFNSYYVTNGHKYAFGVDQGVEPYTGTANHMIKHGTDEALEELKK